MKLKESRKGSITEPLLKDLMDRQKADTQIAAREVSIGSTPLAPPDEYQDAGGGFNPDFTFPQE